jgi:hypothetical protein
MNDIYAWNSRNKLVIEMLDVTSFASLCLFLRYSFRMKNIDVYLGIESQSAIDQVKAHW